MYILFRVFGCIWTEFRVDESQDKGLYSPKLQRHKIHILSLDIL